MTQEQKIDKIFEAVNSMKIEVAKSIVYQEQQRKELDILTPKVEKIDKNQAKHATVLSIAGLTATAFFSWLFKTH